MASFSAARLTRAVLPKTDPTWRFALGARAESVGLLLELTDSDGRVGIGWTSEIPHLGYDIEVLEAVARAHLPRNLAADPADRHALVGNPWQPTLAGPVRSMVDMAWWDLLGRTTGAPVYRLLGGPAPKALRVNRILALKAPDEMAKVAAGLAEEDYDHFKIKVENAPPALDVERVRAIREAVGPDAVLTVDANQSYDRKGAVAFGAAIAGYGVAVFDQPVPQHDLAGLRFVTEHSELTVEADEAADSLLAVRELLRERAVDAVSLKLSKLGGIDALLLAANLCHAHGVLRHVTIPLVRAPLLGAWSFIFFSSFRELSIAAFLVTATSPLLSTQLLDLFVNGNLSLVAALDVVITVVSLVIGLATRRVTKLRF